jgi:hypothetical protein
MRLTTYTTPSQFTNLMWDLIFWVSHQLYLYTIVVDDSYQNKIIVLASCNSIRKPLSFLGVTPTTFIYYCC